MDESPSILIRIELIRTRHTYAHRLQHVHNLNGPGVCVQHFLQLPVDKGLSSVPAPRSATPNCRTASSICAVVI